MSRAVWAGRVQADLVRIDNFNARRDPDFATRVGRAAIAEGEFLADHPAAGPPLENGERKWRVPHTDFVLVYRMTGNGVEILRAYHGRDHGRENWRRKQ